jgi:hypothetical protein
MGRTTRRTQAASHKPVSSIQPNQAGGKRPAPPANAFLGRPERVPQLVYIADFTADGFLGQALEYYEFFGIEVKRVTSIHEMVVDLGTRGGVFERLCLVSHAHPLGMFLPMFTGAARGTNKELFKALAKSDLDGLLTLSPFQAQTKHLQPWGTSPRIDRAMKAVRTANAAVLKPFGLDKSGTPPAGDLSQFFFHCFDIVFIKAPDPDVLTVKGAPLASADRQTLLNFVGEILNQYTRRLEGKSVGGHQVKTADLEALRASVTSIPFDDIGLPPGQSFDMDLDNTTLNSFPSLRAIVTAIQGGFRKQLDAARSKMSATTLFDIRGCRAAEDAEYVTSVSEFLGKPGGAHPTVTAPQLFQAYMEFMFDTVRDRASIRTWLGREQRRHSPQQLRENLTTWAELIRVRPLHTDFWSALLNGPAVRFAATTWPAEIPKLFIPTPGLDALPTTDIGRMIAALTNFFDVPRAAVPNAAAVTAIRAAIPSATAAAPTLLAPVKAPIAVDRLKRLYDGLKAINAAEGQTIVPDTPPNPLRADDIVGFQKGLLDYFDEKPLAALKNFMTAAAENLKEGGDGLFYYMFFAGLPAFIFGRPEPQRNSIVVFTPFAREIQQSWYRCTWADPLPRTGRYLTTAINNALAHTMPALIGDDRRSVTSVCPLPRYGHCMVTRPLPPGEVDGPCGDISNP